MSVEPLKTIGLGGESPMYHPSENLVLLGLGLVQLVNLDVQNTLILRALSLRI